MLQAIDKIPTGFEKSKKDCDQRSRGIVFKKESLDFKEM